MFYLTRKVVAMFIEMTGQTYTTIGVGLDALASLIDPEQYPARDLSFERHPSNYDGYIHEPETSTP